jgi:hypothetical protein
MNDRGLAEATVIQMGEAYCCTPILSGYDYRQAAQNIEGTHDWS